MPTNSFIEIKKEKEKKEEILWEEVMLINSQHMRAQATQA